MISHPLQKVGIESEPLALRKYPPQTVSRISDQIREKLISVTVTIPQKGQGRDRSRRRNPVDFDVIQSLVGENNETSEMHTTELAERNDSVFRIDDAGPKVHGGQKGSQFILPAGIDRCDHHEMRLWSHGAERSSLKLHSRYRPGDAIHDQMASRPKIKTLRQNL